MASRESVDSAVDTILSEDSLVLIEGWCKDGYKLEDIALQFGISLQRFMSLSKQYSEIRQALDAGNAMRMVITDYRVENALLKSALGFKTREVKVTAKMIRGKVVEETKETIDKEFAPNVTAIQYYLNNRRSDKWKPAQARANGILDEMDEDTSIHITVERASNIEGTNNIKVAKDEVDTDWQQDVNKSVSLRKATPEEQKQAEENKKQKQRSSAENEDWSEENSLVGIGTKKQTTSKKKSHSSAVNKKQADSTVADDSTVDLDAWPDDWEDDDEV